VDRVVGYNPGFASRFPVKFTFSDYTEAQLKNIFLGMLRKDGYALQTKRECGVSIASILAARVAQAAFAPATPVAHAPQAVRAPAVLVPAAAPEQDNRLLRYVLTLTSVAAAATILVVLAARDNRLPDGDGLRAAERPQISMDTALERLEALQRAEAAQVRKP